MGAYSSEGAGPGGVKKIQAKNNNNGPHIIAAGSVTFSWKAEIILPLELPHPPEKYSVMAIQSDSSSDDGNPKHPPHIEKLDANGHNQSQGFDSNMKGFILHSGDPNERSYMWMVVKNGFWIGN